MLLLLLWLPGCTNSRVPKDLMSAQLSRDVLFSKEVLYKSAHDPGYIVSMDGDTFWHHYRNGGLFAEEGAVLRLTYSDAEGTRLTSAGSGAWVPVTMSGSENHPINQLCEACLSGPYSGSTAGIAGCYSDAVDRWEATMIRSLIILRDTQAPETWNAVKDMHEAWLTYKESRYAAGRVLSESGGTVGAIEGAARAAAACEHHALFLESLVEQLTIVD